MAAAAAAVAEEAERLNTIQYSATARRYHCSYLLPPTQVQAQTQEQERQQDEGQLVGVEAEVELLFRPSQSHKLRISRQ